ncbi:alpha/beta fold hydrolase [Nostocoides sp.]|jgi:pimeloyl-ACP methyl ester carboxylesterase|uniref:alpha/beta fold hydrolase n=1 Tax=Nostocoides sp. TaxID=1917966 RepID=UPI002CD5DEA0|nr:alpha/beta hydrolase [Tetrasphaera sp.]
MIQHRVVGSGPHTVFVLHGWFGSADGWGSFPDYLDRERFTYVFTDNRGYGARLDVAGEYSLDEVAGDVLSLARDRGVESFSLVGHSMGGAEVLRILAKAPDRVRKLVGVTPVGAQPVPLDDAGTELFFGAPDDRAKRYAIIDFTTGNRLTPTFVNAIVEHSLQNSTVAAFRGALEAWVNPNFLAAVEGNQTPMLVLAGEHDPALGLATVSQTWAPYFPNCTVEVLANAGHYPMFETPVALASSIENFLRD